MKKYMIFDTRDEFGSWSVIDNEIHRLNPFNWRAAIVFMGKKSECNKWIKEHEMSGSVVETGKF